MAFSFQMLCDVAHILLSTWKVIHSLLDRLTGILKYSTQSSPPLPEAFFDLPNKNLKHSTVYISVMASPQVSLVLWQHTEQLERQPILWLLYLLRA